MHGRPKGWLGLGLAARSGGETTRITVRGAHDGTLAGLLVVAGQWQDAAGELVGATRRASSKAVGGGAHPSGGTTCRLWRMLRVAVFVGGEGVLVAGGDGGTGLQCRCRKRKVRAASNGDNGG
jgi:hypothetical protein